MSHEILGTVMPVLKIKLNKGEKLYAQTGAMKWMDNNINMETQMKGGVFGALKRSISGEGMFIVNFTCSEDNSELAFGHSFPGTIIPVDMARGTLICQRRAFLCAYDSVQYDIYLQKRLGAGFFGGEGFIMQKLSGEGYAFIELDGECIEKELKAGEKIRVETGAVGAFEETVDFNIERLKGFKNMFLGGEGIFITTLTGPGKVWLQTMAIQSMAGEIRRYIGGVSSK